MTTQATAETKTTDYHYVTTVQTREGVLNTRDGVLSVPAGFKRSACYHHLLGQLREEYGAPISVLYFALEPEQL